MTSNWYDEKMRLPSILETCAQIPLITIRYNLCNILITCCKITYLKIKMIILSQGKTFYRVGGFPPLQVTHDIAFHY